MTTAYLSVPDALKQFYQAEYLYNVLPLDVVGDTLGALYGKRRNLSVLRRLYREDDAAWREVVPPGSDIAAALGMRRLLYDRLAVSRTRSREPITLAPLGLEMVGETQRDKSVANAYRAVGSLAARFFTPLAREQLATYVARWAELPLARLARTILAYADRRANVNGVTTTNGAVHPEDGDHAVAREDMQHLMLAWAAGSFGSEQQLDHLRALVCFHLTLHAFRRASGPLEHRENDRGTRLFFVCDAAQVVGSPISRAAYHSLVFWIGRVREANFELCARSAQTLRDSDPETWDRVFAEIAAKPDNAREDAIVRRSANIATWVFPDDKRKRGRSADDLNEGIARELSLLYGRSLDGQPAVTAQTNAVAQALYDVFSARGRILHKVGDFVRGSGDGGGLIGPKGTHQRKRFLLRADLLEVLAIIHLARARVGLVASDDQLAAGTVLDGWFERYGIVVDPSRPSVNTAIDRGTVDERILAALPDASLGADNLREFEDRLVELRLARRYSDASVSLDDTVLRREPAEATR